MKSKMNDSTQMPFGTKTPILLQIVIVFMYTTVVRQGFNLLHLYMTEGIKAMAVEKNVPALQAVVAVYGIEVSIAFAFEMVSLEGTKIMFLYEHDIPVLFHSAKRLCYFFLKKIVSLNLTNPSWKCCCQS